MDSTTRGISLADEQLGSLTLGGFLRDVCTKYADREALVFHTPERAVRMTYAQVWAEANSVARSLVARGVTKDTRVGVLATNRPEWITAVFGVALAGGVGVALSTFAKAAELEYMLRVSDVSLLIVERNVLERDFVAELLELVPELAMQAPAYSTRMPFLRRAVVIGEAPKGAFESWSEFVHGGPHAPAALVDAIADEVSPVDRGMIFFSSGSTSKPKSIVHMHRAAAIQCWRWRDIYNVDTNVRTWAANGFFWSGNFASALGTTFAAGGCLVLQRVFLGDEALELIQKERVTLPIAWPHQWVRLVEAPGYEKADLSTLKYVGDTSPLRKHPTVKTSWEEPMFCYGNTETLTLNTAYPSGTDSKTVGGSHGVPLGGNILRIVEPVTGKVLNRNEPGEIAVKGPTTMLGYLRVALEDTFDEEGFFRTGDGGFIDEEGRLHWKGRLNDIIKTGGANVSPLEIDAVLKECPGVKIAATVGVPHDTLGEIVVACIVSKPDEQLDEAQVRGFVGKRLSSFKVPRRVLFVAESDLELTASNKVKTAPLKALAAKRLAEDFS